MRWLVAGSILLALRLSAAVDPDSTPQQADIPFLTGTAPPDDSGYFQANLNPLVVQRTLNAYGGLADSADEDVDFGWRIPFTNNLSFGYDTGLNAFRQDSDDLGLRRGDLGGLDRFHEQAEHRNPERHQPDLDRFRAEPAQLH